MNKTKIVFDVYDMHCKSCESLIEDELKTIKGVLSSRANRNKGSVTVTYDSDLCSEKDIKKGINTAGYSTKESRTKNIISLFLLVAIIILANKFSDVPISNNINVETSYFILFIGGILSSFHCVGMCGGLVLSQTLNEGNLLNNKKSLLKSSLRYNISRILSYTIVGGLAGLLGSVFSISTKTQGLIQIFVSIFMIFTGLKIVGFKPLNKISSNIKIFKIKKSSKIENPIILGMLNGLMPCGALQTMQIYALGTGNFINGAFSMLSFALGTLPLMLFFGYISSKISNSFGKSIVKYSGVFIIILGLGMAQRGLSLNGYNLTNLNLFNNSKTNESVLAPVVNGYQEVTVIADGYNYEVSNSITSNLPIRVKFEGKLTSGCNSVLYIPSINKYVDIRSEENIIEIPSTNKSISFTCWMGMISGEIPFVKEKY